MTSIGARGDTRTGDPRRQPLSVLIGTSVRGVTICTALRDPFVPAALSLDSRASPSHETRSRALTRFLDKLRAATRRNDSLLCVGLDIDPSKVANGLLDSAKGIEAFNRGIVEATSDLVCAYKPNLAFYEALGLTGWEGLKLTLQAIPDDIPVIADGKRGDIGNTSEAYAGPLRRLDFDAATLAPYVGLEGLDPFLRYHDRGLLILCKTSNPGSGDFQDLIVEWKCQRLPLYEVVARRVDEWNRQARGSGPCGLVVGATYPQQLAEIAPWHRTYRS